MNRTQHDLLGALTLAVGVFSALAAAGAAHLWGEVGAYRNSIPSHMTEGSVGFALQIEPLLFTVGSIVVGLTAAGLLIVSCTSHRAERQPLFTWLHIGTALSLLPCLYLTFRLALSLLR